MAAEAEVIAMGRRLAAILAAKDEAGLYELLEGGQDHQRLVMQAFDLVLPQLDDAVNTWWFGQMPARFDLVLTRSAERYSLYRRRCRKEECD